MASSQSVFLTAVVAMVLGIVIGVVGLAALSSQLSPTAADVAAELEDAQQEPQLYGER
jgi:uncharacterized membrane-anchored protein YhcB (DUF1043 family)